MRTEASGRASKRPAIWLGPEYTLNRVGDAYYDQLEQSGHASRLSDLDAIAGLGVRQVRYPVLWERIAPDGLSQADWSWTDARLQRLQELGIAPVAGLLHHGSGPPYTDLLDAEFPEKLAEFAGAVARRYPWVETYTPVNEPLTTARFSGLYGHWYPHRRDDASFARALINQVKGVVLAMNAIRAVNPRARLLQTEDLGKVYSTPELRHQADWENERRWLTFDLLEGGVNSRHPLWGYLCDSLDDDRDLLWLQRHHVSPDRLGLNHYLSSERFLDHRTELYPTSEIGSNGREPYADVLAARVLPDGVAGAGGLIIEAWQRYGRPIVLSEVHNGCTREEQARWLLHMWRAALDAVVQGCDLQAICVWAAFGSFDWDSLVTLPRGHYEPGVFDVRAPAPRPTLLASIVRDLVEGREPTQPILDTPGWWLRPERFIYGGVYPD